MEVQQDIPGKTTPQEAFYTSWIFLFNVQIFYQGDSVLDVRMGHFDSHTPSGISIVFAKKIRQWPIQIMSKTSSMDG
jgi:hypothetical protein